MNFTLALETIQFLVNETNYIPWMAAFNNLAYIGARFKSSEIDIYKVNMGQMRIQLKMIDSHGKCDRNTLYVCWPMRTHIWDSASERTTPDWIFTIALTF